MSDNNINNIDNSINNENKSSNDDAKTIAYNLAKKIYELDSNVYESVGSELGRVFIGDADKCLDKLSALIYTNPHGYLLRSEVALVGNMARTIKDKEAKSKFMRQYNDILNEIAELPHGFGSVDILDTSISELNVSNFHRNNNDNRMIICISRTEGSAGTDIGFALADKLRLNYYDAEIFKDLVIRKDAEKDARWKSKKIDLSHEMINPENEPSPLSFHLRFRKVYLSDVRQDSPQKFHQYIKLAVRSFYRGFLQYKGRINLLDYLRL